MCRYMSNAEHLMVAIDHEKPLIGQPLNDVLVLARARRRGRLLLRAGQPQAQWGLVLETIHYALAAADAQEYLLGNQECEEARKRIDKLIRFLASVLPWIPYFSNAMNFSG